MALQTGRLVFAEGAATEGSAALLNSAKAFSSLARGAATSTATRGFGSQLGKCRCSCGKLMCMGNHSALHTSAGASAAQPAVADEAPHAPSLTAR
jgi:hypothetical protein